MYRRAGPASRERSGVGSTAALPAMADTPLYMPEQAECEFIDTFIDYDDISIVGKREEKEEEEEAILIEVEPSGESARQPAVTQADKTRKDRIRERILWLRSRSKLTIRNLGWSRKDFKRFRLQITGKLGRRQRSNKCEGVKEKDEAKEIVTVQTFSICPVKPILKTTGLTDSQQGITHRLV